MELKLGLLGGLFIMLYLLFRWLRSGQNQHRVLVSKLDEIRHAVNEAKEAEVAAIGDLRNDLVDLVTRPKLPALPPPRPR